MKQTKYQPGNFTFQSVSPLSNRLIVIRVELNRVIDLNPKTESDEN